MNEPTKAQLICDAKKLLTDLNQWFDEEKAAGRDPYQDRTMLYLRREIMVFLNVNPPVKENLTTEKEKV